MTPLEGAHAELCARYREAGLGDGEIEGLAVPDIKGDGYFADYMAESGQAYQHGVGAILFAQDEDVMGWLFGHVREG